ncbi:PIN domain-containing protein [Synechococcus sp. CS-1331]|jgi:predicted nucleic acid-binding protein|uniref:PIN domain-containing protein n=1 Tax=Synechococcus sp. CS-1331 TaxID=2847973 RepID=UPI0019BF47A1|nr:PIN domain-containing protein [Synechococcus sp. CS-1331]MCT0226610.1 PIN domain-containing protein [Synechococcus sp. CS-1331]NQW39464.1 PIN domain-containing protein [Cyanobacteria bacterium bin.275]
MTAGCFLDTNVLLYAVSTTPAEALKRQLARYLLNEDDWTVSVQVFQEFYVQATRATRADRLALADAVALIGSWERFNVQPVDSAVLHGALALHQAYPLSYWDAAILAAAQQSGCTLVLSEDMSDGETYGTVTVRNPFAVICS